MGGPDDRRPGGATWSYPSLQGHTLTTGDGNATTGIQLYDPFGQPLAPGTLAIGTAEADDTGLTNETTGWHESSQKLAEAAGSSLLIEMGARLYVPSLGRFLQLDPVEGGADNSYVWPTDPIGKSDTSGRAWWEDVGKAITSNPLLEFGCMFAFGLAGTICSSVKAIGYAMQGDLGGVAIELLGAATGGLASKAASAITLMRATTKIVSNVSHSVTRASMRQTSSVSGRFAEVAASNAFTGVVGRRTPVSNPEAPMRSGSTTSAFRKSYAFGYVILQGFRVNRGMF